MYDTNNEIKTPADKKFIEELVKLCFDNSSIRDFKSVSYEPSPFNENEGKISYENSKLDIDFRLENTTYDIDSPYKLNNFLDDVFLFINTIFPYTDFSLYIAYVGHNGYVEGEYFCSFNSSEMETHISHERVDYTTYAGDYDGYDDAKKESYSYDFEISEEAFKKRKRFFEFIITKAKGSGNELLADFLIKKIQSLYFPDKPDIDESDLENKTLVWKAFCYCDKVVSVSLPTGLTGIGIKAFYKCKKLKKVVLPDSVTSIGNSAFSWCSSLTAVTIPDSVTSIGDSAFYRCEKLKSVTIPDSVTSIGNSAFWYCSSLTAVKIGNSVTSIGNSAFYDCKNLTAVTIGNSVTSIGNSAFSWCSSLTAVTIGNSVTSIGNSAFSWCSSLTAVTIPDSVTSIGDSAFEECTNLKSVVIPDSITDIGKCAFKKCKLADNNKFIIINNILFDYRGRNEEITIPDNVKIIASEAVNCKKITSVIIPDSVDYISDYAFCGCTSLKSVSVSKNTAVANYAFIGTGFKKIPIFGYEIDGSKCNWKKTYPRVIKEMLSVIKKMLSDKDYSAKIENTIKFQLVCKVFFKESQPEAEAFIKKNIAKILPFFIDVDDYETVKALLESGKFVTKQNIMKFIDHTVEHTKNGGDIRIQELLTSYKSDHFPE